MQVHNLENVQQLGKCMCVCVGGCLVYKTKLRLLLLILALLKGEKLLLLESLSSKESIFFALLNGLQGQIQQPKGFALVLIGTGTPMIGISSRRHRSAACGRRRSLLAASSGRMIGRMHASSSLLKKQGGKVDAMLLLVFLEGRATITRGGPSSFPFLTKGKPRGGMQETGPIRSLDEIAFFTCLTPIPTVAIIFVRIAIFFVLQDIGGYPDAIPFFVRVIDVAGNPIETDFGVKGNDRCVGKRRSCTLGLLGTENGRGRFGLLLGGQCGGVGWRRKW